MANTRFSDLLISWFNRHGRKDLPWQSRPTPYRVWVSEIMLQQTQVATVIPYFNRFIKKFPNMQSLAKADIDTVLSHWAGLGYYARGRNLHRAARIICRDYGGRLPADKEKLMALPGIGPSTAGAIMALAFNRRHAILDGNVKRVLSRFYAVAGWSGESGVEKKLWRLAEHNTPGKEVAVYTQAIMDLGATICTRSRPKCEACPVASGCSARRQQAQHQYPAPAPKKAKPVHRKTFLILRNEADEILLQKYPPAGVWGGLWGFLECGPGQNISRWLLKETGCHASAGIQLPVVKHALTHFNMHILPVSLRVKQGHSLNGIRAADHRQWYIPEQALTLAIPKPVKDLLLEISGREPVSRID